MTRIQLIDCIMQTWIANLKNKLFNPTIMHTLNLAAYNVYEREFVIPDTEEPPECNQDIRTHARSWLGLCGKSLSVG